MNKELTNKVVPLDSLLKAIDEYVLEQKNHQLTRTPERMSTIECVADWCKKFAIGLSEPKSTAPMRITRSRKQKQVSPNGLPIIYVGRPTKWGNPFKVTGQEGHWFVMSDDGHPLVCFEKKEDAIACCVENYKEYITHEHNLGIKNIADLIGKNLSCWCPKDCLCHADVLLEIAAKIDRLKIKIVA